MRLCNAIPARLHAMNKSKQYNTLNTSDLGDGGGIAQRIIHPEFLYTTFSDARQGYLMDVSYPLRMSASDILSEYSLSTLCSSKESISLEYELLKTLCETNLQVPFKTR